MHLKISLRDKINAVLMHLKISLRDKINAISVPKCNNRKSFSSKMDPQLAISPVVRKGLSDLTYRGFCENGLHM